MERLTERMENVVVYKFGNHADTTAAECEPWDTRNILERLCDIEDILGNDYDLEQLRELVEAKKDNRLIFAYRQENDMKAISDALVDALNRRGIKENERSTGGMCPDECRDCTHCETCGHVFENKGGPCPYREQGKNEQTATAQDILNLATAYAVVQKNKKTGNGYQINDRYYEGILDALEKTTGKYCEQFAGEQEKRGKDANSGYDY